MSHLFADIYDGIRFLRILKGVSEKDILNYVQARVGNMKVGNVLKTIRTLRKLVDEGILVKKGKRYSFSGKCPKRECYETEDDNQGDDCDEDDECDLEEDDAKDEQDDDDDDEDDDGCGDEEDGEEDDLDEDEDDDDETCNNDNQEGGDGPGKEEKKMDDTNSKEGKKIDSKSSFIMKPKVEQNRDSNNMRSSSNATDKTRDDVVTPVSEPESERRRGNKRRRSYLEESEAENRSSQGIAFCARDFIDSLQPSKDEETKKILDSQRKSHSNTESRERLEKFTPRNRRSRLKWEREPHCSYRSRSPVKGRNRDCYDTLNMGRSNNFGYRSSNALFQDPADNEGEIDEKKTEPEPKGPSPQTKTQEGSQPKESLRSPSRDSKYVLEVIESEVSLKESLDNCISQNRAPVASGSRRNWLEMEDRRQERTKRGLSDDDIRSYDDKAESLCSVCDKKRRNS